MLKINHLVLARASESILLVSMESMPVPVGSKPLTLILAQMAGCLEVDETRQTKHIQTTV